MTKFNSKILENSESSSNDSNQKWWQDNPMTYDWDGELGEITLDQDYYKNIDNIFGEGHSLLNNPRWPDGYILENFIPYEDLKEKKVLEVGCGAGLVSGHIAKSGAGLTAIDLTEYSINMTSKRFELQNLDATIVQMDAESMNFDDDTFDFVVSWGVIHHSGNMIKIIDEIHRVLKPGGKAFLMVYNKNSIRYHIYARFWLGVMKLKLVNNSLSTIVGSITDGHIARHMTKTEMINLTSKFSDSTISFSDEKTTIMKYLFGIGALFSPFYKLTKGLQRYLAKKWGWYLEIQLTK